jgi:hypothetical protein
VAYQPVKDIRKPKEGKKKPVDEQILTPKQIIIQPQGVNPLKEGPQSH